MECMNNCGNELTGRQRTYCSDKCRKQAKRVNSDAPASAQSTNSDKEVVNCPANSDTVRLAEPDSTNSDKPYEVIPDVKVYGRQAVRYSGLHEAWDFRPEPLSPDDTPMALNRGKYIRPDGSEYIFDACGKVFECVWDESLQQTVVYKTLAEVQAQTA